MPVRRSSLPVWASFQYHVHLNGWKFFAFTRTAFILSITASVPHPICLKGWNYTIMDGSMTTRFVIASCSMGIRAENETMQSNQISLMSHGKGAVYYQLSLYDGTFNFIKNPFNDIREMHRKRQTV